MIHIKKCRRCERSFDIEECPYCREEKIKEKMLIQMKGRKNKNV